MDNELLHYLHNNFGPMVHFRTGYRGDIYTFRCHPNYGSAGPIYDWMIIKYITGLYHFQLAVVVLDESFCERSAFSCTKHYNMFFGEINFISRVELFSREHNRLAQYNCVPMICDISKSSKR